jgi:broad specificity phosphatase PhoE
LKKYRIKDKNFDCILSSPMKRAIETAEIIGKELKLSKKIEILDSLIELRRGKFYMDYQKMISIRQKLRRKLKKNKRKLEIQLSIFMNLIWINI